MSALKYILKGIKTTVIGGVLISVPIMTHLNGIHSFDLYSLIAVVFGIVFLFSPDKILDAIPRLIDAIINTLGGSSHSDSGKDKDSNDINITFNRDKRR